MAAAWSSRHLKPQPCEASLRPILCPAPPHPSRFLQVIRRANDTPYGLASGVFSTNVDSINTLTRGIKAGTVWWAPGHAVHHARQIALS